MTSVTIKTVYDWAQDTQDPEPKMCKQFGCGRKLELFEQLCGEYCADHSKKQFDTHIKEVNEPTMLVMVEFNTPIREWDLDINEEILENA